MKKEQKCIKRITWLTVSLVAGIHFLAAQANVVESVQLLMPDVKIDSQDCFSQPIPWKTVIGIFMPACIG